MPDFKKITLNIDDLKFQIKLLENGNLKAIASIDFGDFVVKGFRINLSAYKNESGENLWITPPSYKDGGEKYHPIFFIPDKALWKKLEQRLVIEYNKASNEYYQKRLNIKAGEVAEY